MCAAIFFFLFISSVQQADGQSKFPDKAITFLVAYGAGGGTDIMARGIQPFVEKLIGARLIIENVPGGSGIVGMNKLWNAKPDGHTVGICTLPSIVSVKIMFNPGYDPEKFTPIATWADEPMVLAAHAEAFESFNQFMETARKKKLSIGHAGGTGGNSWIVNLAIEKETGIFFNKVPYSDSAAVPAQVAGKHLDAMIGVSSSILSFAKSGALKPLVVFYAKRDLLFPDVPTAKELGYKFPDFPINRGVIGPPNMPRDRTKVLEAAFLKAAEDPEYVELCRKMNIIINPLSSEAYGRKIRDEFKFLEPFSDMLRKK